MSKKQFNELELQFQEECEVINLKYEYDGYNGDISWAIISNLTEDEILEKYRSIIGDYMPAFLCDELREYIDMLYFPAPDQRIFTITKSKLTNRFHKLSEEAGLRRITVHGLRHSHVSLLISKKYDIFEVSKRIGHKSIKTTQDIYGHLFDEVQKTIANDLDSLRRR